MARSFLIHISTRFQIKHLARAQNSMYRKFRATDSL